jgi:RHH-type rel operon transcriptional repressor/antitoxin RelB
MLAVKINDPLLEKHLAAEARHQGKSRSALAREAIDHYLEDLEDYRDAVAVMADIRSGRTAVISSEEMERRLALAD